MNVYVDIRIKAYVIWYLCRSASTHTQSHTHAPPHPHTPTCTHTRTHTTHRHSRHVHHKHDEHKSSEELKRTVPPPVLFVPSVHNQKEISKFLWVLCRCAREERESERDMSLPQNTVQSSWPCRQQHTTETIKVSKRK